MSDTADDRSPARDRATVARVARDLVLGVVRRRTPAGTSVVIEGPPGIGKTFLVREILTGLEPGEAKLLQVAGNQRRRNEPLAVVGQLLASAAPGRDPGDEAFDHVDELCADGPVVMWVDDAHHLDAASLTLLRRLAWASRSLPLVMLITARPAPSREHLTMLIQQAQVRLRLPPMDRMMVERLVLERTGRWPGPRLRHILEQAAGNPLFAGELLRAHRAADALAELGPDSLEARWELPARETGLDELIRTQLRQLDEPTREVLAALSVWGTEVGAADLAELLASSAAALEELLQRAISSGLARRDASAAVNFTHDLFREVTYADLPPARRCAIHRQVAQLLTASGYRPALVAEHLLRAAAGQDADPVANPAVMAALSRAVAATRVYAPAVTADLLDDVAASMGSDLSESMLLQRAEALFLAGRGESAAALIRDRITIVADPAVAAKLQAILIRSLANRAELAAALAVIERTTVIAGLPGATLRQLEATRLWLLVQAGQVPPASELDAIMDRFVAAADQEAQAALLPTVACAAFLSGRSDRALELMRSRDELTVDTSSFRLRSSALFLPAVFELDGSGPRVAQAALDRSRRLAAQRHAEWVGPFLGFTAGGIAFTAGDWDGAVAELDSALERAEETNAGWISTPVGIRSYIDAHRGRTGSARARLESFRHRGLPLQFGHDRPGLAELAVLEAEGAVHEAAMLARTLWSVALSIPGRWAAHLAPDVARVALVGMDRRLAGQLADDVSGIHPAEVSRLVHGMLTADPDEISEAAGHLAGTGRLGEETFAREELACAAAAAGDRDRAAAALEAALAGYQRIGAVPDRDRALARARALGIRRGSRQAHRGVDSGWASLTATEVRIAALVRDGLTNREIGTRLYVSPRTVQTHVSHILQKTGLRSRVEIARAAGAEIR